MLNIFTSKRLAEEHNFIVEDDIDTMFRFRSENIKEKYTDPKSMEILTKIEGMTRRNKDRIDGKFGDVSLYDISTGGKGCLLAVNYNDFIINACQLGENCLRLLLDLSEDMDINIVLMDPVYIFDGRVASVDGEVLKGYKISEAIADAYYLEVECDD